MGDALRERGELVPVNPRAELAGPLLVLGLLVASLVALVRRRRRRWF
jgi:hypothetical protein